MNTVSVFSPNSAGNIAGDYAGFKGRSKRGPGTMGNENGIDLNSQLIRDRKDTFFLRVNTDVMLESGIRKGATLIVDRSLNPSDGKIIIALVNGDMLVRRFEKKNNIISLFTDDTRVSPISLNSNCQDFSICGVVTFVIHEP